MIVEGVADWLGILRGGTWASGSTIYIPQTFSSFSSSPFEDKSDSATSYSKLEFYNNANNSSLETTYFAFVDDGPAVRRFFTHIEILFKFYAYLKS